MIVGTTSYVAEILGPGEAFGFTDIGTPTFVKALLWVGPLAQGDELKVTAGEGGTTVYHEFCSAAYQSTQIVFNQPLPTYNLWVETIDSGSLLVYME